MWSGCVFVNDHLLKKSLLPSNRERETGALSFLTITFQWNDSQILLKKSIPALKIYISKEKRKNKGKFNKISALSKGRSGASRQEEACLKLS